MDDKFKSKWESNSFIFDQKDCGYGGVLSWPQRNFTCNFCKKEYKSAQALGGHMNVHRRDRARLRLSSPSLDHLPNPNPNYPSPPSSVYYLPYKTYHSSLFPPSSTPNEEDERSKPLSFARSARDFLGHVRKNVTMEDGDFEGNCVQENEIRVSKKREIFNAEIEMGVLKDGKVERDLDLELRLGRT